MPQHAPCLSRGARFVASLLPRFMAISAVTLIASIAADDAAGFERSVHGEITTDALTKNENKDLNFSEAGLIPIVTANQASDDYPPDGDWYLPEAHFDDEVFAAGSRLLRAKFETVVRSLSASPPEIDVATRDIGRSLHAIQDFCSHSNFVKLDPRPTINLFSLSDPSDTDRKKPLDCSTSQGPLSTGYYYYEDEDYQAGRATKIVRPANRCMHDNLHKDTKDRDGFQEARVAAIMLSRQFLRDLKIRLNRDYPGKNLFDLVRTPRPCQSEYAAHPELRQSGRQVPRPGINWGDGKAYIFQGNQYLRYDLASNKPDAGYPQKIDAKTWPGLWTDGIDAAINWGNGKAYFFKGNQYVRYDIKSGKPDAGFPQKIDAKTWPGLWTSGVDAAVEWDGGKVYFFKGSEYLRYDIKSGKPDAGFPKPLSSETWPGLCSNGIDGAVNWGNGKVYLFKGNWYYRYDVKADHIDLGYPSAVNRGTWPGLTSGGPSTSRLPSAVTRAVGCRPERRIP